LTKPLSQPRHEAHTRAMGMRCFRHVDAWVIDSSANGRLLGLVP
jgi:hypothetical protein